MTDVSDRSRELAEFANASGQSNQPERPPPGGHSLVRPTTGLAERVIGAQPVAVYRDEQKVLQKLATLAAAAGTDWFYRFPVKKKDGGQDWIQGPSIKLANDVARIFGNCAIEVREIDVGDAFVFYARFSDIETGFSMERAYRQRKSQSSMRTRDPDRSLDIAYSIGQSKAIRNVICNALQIYADYAFEQAQNSLVDRIGKNLEAWRKRTLERLAEIPVELPRVERVIGRSVKDWLAPNIAQIVAMVKSIADGMASIDEVFPAIESTSPPAPAAREEVPSATGGEEGGAQAAARASDTASAARKSDSEATDTPAAPAAADQSREDILATAYRRGAEAKAAGQRRAALPGEYRGSAQSKMADAWFAGHDGKPMPHKDDNALI
jgi:hypothetical protein